MISQERALEIAHDAIQGREHHDKPGDITIELGEGKYSVTFSPGTLTEGDGRSRHAIRVDILAQTGEVLEIRETGAQKRRGGEDFISARRAFQIALDAIKGFENYDKAGKLTVELRLDRYAVTFPLVVTPQTGSRRPDFAMQVWVDARSGEILKILTAA